jgi:hypothetical protein
MAGERCVKCGKVRSILPSVVNKWHRCTKCGTIYCPDCGRALPGKASAFSAERACDASFGGGPPCGGRTALF